MKCLFKWIVIFLISWFSRTTPSPVRSCPTLSTPQTVTVTVMSKNTKFTHLVLYSQRTERMDDGEFFDKFGYLINSSINVQKRGAPSARMYYMCKQRNVRMA